MGPKINRTGSAPATNCAVRINDTKTWRVPEETPVAFIYNGRNFAVMLATPDNLEDFAIGFSITERIVDRLDDITEIDIVQSPIGIDLKIKIAPDALTRLDIRQQRRNLVGRAGCGVCGIENADVFFEKLPLVAPAPVTIAQQVLTKALGEFSNHQILNETTKTVHGAAFVSPLGEFISVREDAGRHNALDKVLGSCILRARDMTTGFIMMSSRCSYEIVEKAARCGIKAVASISAPTAFAIRKADEANIALYARDGNSFVAIGNLDHETNFVTDLDTE